jgi:hypothetical protein
MEKDPFLNTNAPPQPTQELLPPPTGMPAYEWELSDLPVDPTLDTPDTFDSPTMEQEQLEPIDTGSIDIAPVGEVVDNLRVSYHGLRYSIARVREQRAQKRIAKLERKDALYSSLRAASVDESITPHKTTNTTEKVMDSRQTKKTRKAQLEELRVIREERVHGSSDVNTKSFKAGRHAGTALRQATGEMTSAEARLERAQTRALPSDKSQRYLRQKQREHAKALEKSRQPIAQRWRSVRRYNAEDTVRKQQSRAQEHLQKAIDIKNS